ncbi:actin binding protein [Malassezia yamatoensis]|uniref:Actin binding protein n=1 Tax=Malassezia yamatoensis TaxID=253288 RepID=A0AAJ5Z1L6_9BASI|nr:actin binding protein [Malassezia yamatoensis]
MSLQVSLASPGIRDAYEKVLDGAKDYLVLSYKKLSNDLDVAASGQGSLEDVTEEFSDGKIQYAFVRVKDPNTQLPKFVLINWCGEGVPENKKGLFASHSATVAQYFQAYHVSINARTDEDLVPAAILRKVLDSSGSKYGAASSMQSSKIEPVGTNYRPIGTPDIRKMQSEATNDPIQPTGTNYVSAREEIQQLRQGILGKSTATQPPPLAPRPAQAPQPTHSRPAPTPGPRISAGAAGSTGAAQVPQPVSTGKKQAGEPSKPVPVMPARPTESAAPASAEVQKPADDDKIQPVGTAYQPVSLGRPGKLSADRTKLFSSTAIEPPSQPVRRGPTNALSWTQRQEAAKKEAQAEAQAATLQATPAPHSANGPDSGIASQATRAPNANNTFAGADSSSQTDHALAAQLEHANLGGQQAVVLYDYDAAEDNELSLKEGDRLSQVDQVDEGWWSATDSNGNTGLFPANYVELIENKAILQSAPTSQDKFTAEAPSEARAPNSAMAPAPESVPSPPPAPPAPPLPPAQESVPSPPPAPPAPPAPPVPPAQESAPSPPPAPPAPPLPPAQESIPSPPPAPPAPPAPSASSTDNVTPAPPAPAALRASETSEFAAPPPPPARPGAESGLEASETPASAEPCAIALYDYEIAEDNELELAEGDIIVQLEFASEDWWSGMNQRTNLIGLFPASFQSRSISALVSFHA